MNYTGWQNVLNTIQNKNGIQSALFIEIESKSEKIKTRYNVLLQDRQAAGGWRLGWMTRWCDGDIVTMARWGKGAGSSIQVAGRGWRAFFWVWVNTDSAANNQQMS